MDAPLCESRLPAKSVRWVQEQLNPVLDTATRVHPSVDQESSAGLQYLQRSGRRAFSTALPVGRTKQRNSPAQRMPAQLGAREIDGERHACTAVEGTGCVRKTHPAAAVHCNGVDSMAR